MSYTARILGCGSSGGLPRIGNDWGDCDPDNPKNYRRRCSLLVSLSSSSGTTRVLIDTSPDLREQMLAAQCRDLDGVLYTHEHADHTHGIDELRAFFLMRKARVNVWADDKTAKLLKQRFNYCFEAQAESDYPPILQLNHLEPGQAVNITGQGGTITALPFALQHGTIQSLGFRIGAMAYTPDLNDIPEASFPALSNLDLWIVDALKRHKHPSHLSLPETLSWIELFKPRRAILTNMHIDMDYASLEQELPATICPAYDGLEIEFSA